MLADRGKMVLFFRQIMFFPRRAKYLNISLLFEAYWLCCRHFITSWNLKDVSIHYRKLHFWCQRWLKNKNPISLMADVPLLAGQWWCKSTTVILAQQKGSMAVIHPEKCGWWNNTRFSTSHVRQLGEVASIFQQIPHLELRSPIPGDITHSQEPVQCGVNNYLNFITHQQLWDLSE